MSNELHIATFNRQSSDLIGKYSAINLMGDLVHVLSLIRDGEMVTEISPIKSQS